MEKVIKILNCDGYNWRPLKTEDVSDIIKVLSTEYVNGSIQNIDIEYTKFDTSEVLNMKFTKFTDLYVEVTISQNGWYSVRFKSSYNVNRETLETINFDVVRSCIRTLSIVMNEYVKGINLCD